MAAGYSKKADGLAIARAMTAPPYELKVSLTRFLKD
jgi:hypothetical protein